MSIQFFPSEILAQIFATASQGNEGMIELTHVSAVSRWWRAATLCASELWLNIYILETDINHADVVLDDFQRSQERPVSLDLEFTSQEPHATPSQMRTFLESVVQSNIKRCRSLTVWATRPVWDAILATFEQETYPVLRALDIMEAFYWSREQPHPSPDELTFPLPRNHPLEKLVMHAMNVGDVMLPRMRALRVGDLRGLVGADGRINSWLLQGSRKLELCHLEIPPMHFQTVEERIPAASSVVHLKLARIHASSSAYGTQNDCAPFFDALETPQIRTLELEEFHGRVWEDFLFTLHTPTLKYPLLTILLLKSFDFQDLSYTGVTLFLRSFPGLESVVLTGCPLVTWECCIHVLMLHPALCPNVSLVEVNGVLLDRHEPLPFATARLLEDHEKRERRIQGRSFENQELV
ncbi:hypothetical protein DFH08DRAFT_810787 [Mycena albidolilacea]|uniref:F-box domain-containing protein n=1 Tax=Mycena albidolilacea TaxID=1033008 RepID=A0AAD6ZX81_9AGAR|nr:hypothetical protein DFH08DRAFT_810787 [Mycena albidolilacea]